MRVHLCVNLFCGSVDSEKSRSVLQIVVIMTCGIYHTDFCLATKNKEYSRLSMQHNKIMP